MRLSSELQRKLEKPTDLSATSLAWAELAKSEGVHMNPLSF